MVGGVDRLGAAAAGGRSHTHPWGPGGGVGVIDLIFFNFNI